QRLLSPPRTSFACRPKIPMPPPLPPTTKPNSEASLGFCPTSGPAIGPRNSRDLTCFCSAWVRLATPRPCSPTLLRSIKRRVWWSPIGSRSSTLTASLSLSRSSMAPPRWCSWPAAPTKPTCCIRFWRSRTPLHCPRNGCSRPTENCCGCSTKPPPQSSVAEVRRYQFYWNHRVTENDQGPPMPAQSLYVQYVSRGTFCGCLIVHIVI